MVLVVLVNPALTQVHNFIYISLGSVYLGRDIRTGADVALKIVIGILISPGHSVLV